MKAEGKGPIPPVATRGGKSSLRFSSFREVYLPVAFGEVQCRVKPGPSQPIQQLVHPRHGVSVELGDLVDATEIIAETKGAIQVLDITIGLDHGLCDGSITPDVNICCTSSSIAC